MIREDGMLVTLWRQFVMCLNIWLRFSLTFVQPSSYLTVDEQLVEFHGRVKFRQYIGSKPGKFGMKIFWVCDNDGGYCLNGLVYIGANTVDPETLDESQSVPEAVVMTLMRPFFGSNCNLTGDNWFSSSALVDRLYENRVTYVGTVWSNRRDVPPAARSIENRVRGDTRLYHDGNNLTLCSYWDKGRNSVLLLDSFTDRCSLPEEGKKPDTVLFYNSTKSAVDDMDKKVRMYSTKRKCRRWPYSFIMNLIDIAGSHSLRKKPWAQAIWPEQATRLFFESCGLSTAGQTSSSPLCHKHFESTHYSCLESVGIWSRWEEEPRSDNLGAKKAMPHVPQKQW